MRRLVICSTCNVAPGVKFTPNGQTGGEVLLAAVRSHLAKAGRNDVVVEEQACLWNCSRHCSVLLQDEERFSYITGGHEASEAQAEAIITWFDLHGATQDGEVPFHAWPDRMSGRFIARMPPVKA